MEAYGREVVSHDGCNVFLSRKDCRIGGIGWLFEYFEKPEMPGLQAPHAAYEHQVFINLPRTIRDRGAKHSAQKRQDLR